MNKYDEDDPWLTHISVEGDDGIVREYELPNGGVSHRTFERKLIQYAVQRAWMRSRELGLLDSPPRSKLRITPMDVFVFLCLVNMTGLLVHLLLGWG